MARSAIDLISTVDTLLFGRVTYELMAGYWPSASPPTEDPIIIDRMNNLPKIVFSKTLEKVEWKNTRLIKEIVAEEVLKMKKQPGKNMKDMHKLKLVRTNTFSNGVVLLHYQSDTREVIKV